MIRITRFALIFLAGWSFFPDCFAQDRIQPNACDIPCMEKAALLGNGKIAYEIGNSLLYSNRGKMKEWYRISAENGDINGQHNFAHFLASDSSKAEDCYRAIYWFGIASKRGHKASTGPYRLLRKMVESGATFDGGCAREYSR